MASAQSIYKTTFRIPICPKDLGHFIGKGGSNFKKMILESKKMILGIDGVIPPEDWNKVTIMLKFEKQETDCLALLGCKSEGHALAVQEVLAKFCKTHNDEAEFYQKKAAEPKMMIYRIGAPHSKIGKLIGIGGYNVNQLKAAISKVDGIKSYPTVMIEEQHSRISGPFRNMGERNYPENILVKVRFVGRPNFEDIHKIMDEFVETHLTEDPEEEGRDAFAPDPDEEDFWNDFFDKPEGDQEQEQEQEPQEKNPRGWEVPQESEEDSDEEREHREAILRAAEEERKRKAEEEAEKAKHKPMPPPEPEPEPEQEPNRGYRYARYYNILQIPTTSTTKGIKKAYRKLAVMHHPDKGGDEEMFKRIQEAFEKLTQKPTCE